jgi:Mg-chelatase subunit ChlD
MKHRNGIVIASAALIAVIGQLAASNVRDVAARVPLQAAPCTLTVGKTAAPAQIDLGQTVTVTLKVDGSCPERVVLADVVLAIDHSESMASDGKLQAAQNAAETFVRRMDPAQVRVALVSVSRTAPVIQALTSDQATLVAAIQALTTERGTNIVGGLDAARGVLTGPDARVGARKVIVFLTDGKHTVTSPGAGELDGVIAAVRAAGIEVFAIGLGSDADVDVLKKMASDAAHYYFSPSVAELESIYIQIAGQTQAALLMQTAAITDLLPANMAYIAGSAAPIAPAYDAASRTLSWALADVIVPGLGLSYQVRPTEAGTWPTNVSAKLDYVDRYGNAGTLVFPVPTVRVLAPKPAAATCVCRYIQRHAPRQVIEDAVANPQRYEGWMQPLDPGKPASIANPPRECLTLMNVNVEYHPIWNPPTWRVGCP